MEEVKRQFGQHIAVEPEWEAGFSLQIQLRHIIAMFQDWCSSHVSHFIHFNYFMSIDIITCRDLLLHGFVQFSVLSLLSGRNIDTSFQRVPPSPDVVQ